MGRLGGTDEAGTNKRITQLKEILSFTPDRDEKVQPKHAVEDSDRDQNSGVMWVHRQNIRLTFSFVPGNQPVRYYYDEEELKKWALSDLKPNGIHSPLWVRPLPSGEPGQYELVAGKRRYHGSEFAEIELLPVRVFNWSDLEAFKASLAENKNRQDFSALEDLDGTLKLLALSVEGTVEQAVSLLYQLDNLKRRSGTQNVLGHPLFETVQAVFAFSGGVTWESFVKTRLPLLKLPQEILAAIRQGRIAYTKAVEIAKIKDAETRSAFLDRAIASELSLTEIKQYVRSLKSKPTTDLQIRLDKTYKQFKKSVAAIEQNPKRLQRAEKLLQQFEKFLEQE